MIYAGILLHTAWKHGQEDDSSREKIQQSEFVKKI